MKAIPSILFILIFFCSTLTVNAEADSFPFEVEISGKGTQALLFIPGLACSGEVWNATKANYENDYQCYTLTMAGFAHVPAKGKPTFEYWEQAIARYLQQNNMRPIIVGHSLGGGLAMALAADYPQLVSKIVVVDALPCLAALKNPAFQPNEQLDCSSMVERFKAVPDEQFYHMQKFSMPKLLADSSKVETAVQWSVESDRTTFASLFCDFSNTDLREKIAHIQCPALVLLEAPFVEMKPVIAEQFKKMKTAQLQYANKGLHFIMYDDKAWFDRQLATFIKQ